MDLTQLLTDDQKRRNYKLIAAVSVGDIITVRLPEPCVILGAIKISSTATSDGSAPSTYLAWGLNQFQYWYSYKAKSITPSNYASLVSMVVDLKSQGPLFKFDTLFDGELKFNLAAWPSYNGTVYFLVREMDKP